MVQYFYPTKGSNSSHPSLSTRAVPLTCEAVPSVVSPAEPPELADAAAATLFPADEFWLLAPPPPMDAEVSLDEPGADSLETAKDR